MRRAVALALLALAVHATGCGEVTRSATDTGHDAVVDTTGGMFTDITGGDIHFGGAETVADADAPEVDAAVSAEWPPCLVDGGPGCPCDTNAECDSGYCVPTGSGGTCTTTCSDSCPSGWSCSKVSSTPPDVVYLCVPLWTNLCRPCETGADCSQEGGTGGYCIPSEDGQGSFCGGTCSDEQPCPTGFSCDSIELPDGEATQQCRPVDGECTCNAGATKEGAHTTCRIENEIGACTGVRQCELGGLSECNAAEPAAESCNGLDDDCDGQTDNGLDTSCVRTNAFGTCEGTRLCLEGQWTSCDGPEPALEECNGKDDDCDGLTDEGFDNTDGDKKADCIDEDDDDDGVLDGADVCPLVADPLQKDTDGDGAGDACDDDIDGDGAKNGEDCLPSDPTHVCTVYFHDGDGDGAAKCSAKQCLCAPTGTYTQLVCTVTDCDDESAAVGPGFEELCDGLDNDCNGKVDDGVPDTDGDGVKDACDPDDDGDGKPDTLDNCKLVSNPDQADADADGIGDACDGDGDGDSVDDLVDNCVGVWNPGQEDCEGNGKGDACDAADVDGDSVDCPDDNCPLVPNPDQEDCDGDGKGDACSADDDADGTPDTADCAPCDPAAYPGAPEVCNAIDDDCDGKVDEGFATLGVPCDGPDGDSCKGGVFVCAADGAGTVCGESAVGGFTELCNGTDDDCDGEVDEGYAGLGAACDGPDADNCANGLGKCAEDGSEVVCDEPGAGHAETCNGLDDDCDGEVDEGYAGLGLPCDGPDEDACAGGQLVCSPDGAAVACEEQAGASQAEVCNGLDDDCDGETDEDFPTLGQPCDGPDDDLCALGAIACGADGGATCSEGLELAKTELCNGADDDCDGETDEDFPGVGLPCDGPDADLCPDGTLSCTGNGAGTTCVGDAADTKVETCNGLDDDCNGETDEGFLGLGVACDGPDLDVCKDGTVVCSADGQGIVCSDDADDEHKERCNGLDDDCDGVIDEGFAGLGEPCDGPDGDQCAGGEGVCAEDEQGVLCDEAPGPGTLETCNGLDDDCDGETDEGFAGLGDACDGPDADLCAGGAVVCAADGLGTTCKDDAGGVELCDGKDNDCDGVIDEGYPGLGTACDSDDTDECEYGTVVCAPGGLGTTCKETIVDLYEVCDGNDNDCDGLIDNGFADLGAACDGPDADNCMNGKRICAQGGATTTCSEPGAGFAEACNGNDDDCDGLVDEAFSDLGVACDGPDADACALGVRVCAAGGAGTTCLEAGPAIVETCNGEDDDCDGETDEGFGVGEPCDGADADLCANGVTACDGAGEAVCDEAVVDLVELCNGEDDDCDGEVDEGFPELGEPCDGPDTDACDNGLVVCAESGLGTTCGAEQVMDIEESCANALDDDCDGLVNEGCTAAAARFGFHSFVLPFGAAKPGGVYGVRAAGGEPVIGTMSGGAGYKVRLGLYPSLPSP